MADFIIAVGLILFLLTGWISVQHLVQRYALKHPEFGPPREEGNGCGKSCMCTNGSCKNRQSKSDAIQ